MGRLPALRSHDGFTLVELMAAALVLVVGMLSILTVLHSGIEKTTLSQQRVAANNLARELTETARTADYDTLTPSGAATALQAANVQLASESPSEWTVKRGSTTYTIEATACTFDDPADDLQASPAVGNRCANNPGGAAGDANGDDFRRLAFDVSWIDLSHNQKYVHTQTTLVANPAGGIGPRIVSFPDAAAVGPGATTATFTVNTTYAASVHWNADDGTSEGDATPNASRTVWTITWPLKAVGAAGAILDGTYFVTAQALDDRGIAGDSKLATVTINRSAPFAPTGFNGGHDTRSGDWVDLVWQLNPERDIVGYQVFWAGADGIVGNANDVRVCPSPAAGATYLGKAVSSCQDLTPPNGAAKYYIQALDSTQTGARTELSIPAPGPRPGAPASLGVAGAEAPTLSWTAPASGTVKFYRIYRDGMAVGDRIGTSDTLSYTDVDDGKVHSYYVSTVDDKYNESDLVGPVQWP
jgi:Tfp pilus assembly protein PilV